MFGDSDGCGSGCLFWEFVIPPNLKKAGLRIRACFVRGGQSQDDLPSALPSLPSSLCVSGVTFAPVTNRLRNTELIPSYLLYPAY